MTNNERDKQLADINAKIDIVRVQIAEAQLEIAGLEVLRSKVYQEYSTALLQATPSA